MNTPIVEAQSLSNLTNLFANPPQYPRNPTHQVHEPLVLYIVRVPGSRGPRRLEELVVSLLITADVFLSPIKPPTKVSVSLDAIQSSLYYFHVNTEQDEEIRRSIDQQGILEEPIRRSAPIVRKPVPSSPLANDTLPSIPLREGQYTAYNPRLQASNAPQGYSDEYRTSLRVDTNTNQNKPISFTTSVHGNKSVGDYALSPTTPGSKTEWPPCGIESGDIPESAYVNSSAYEYDQFTNGQQPPLPPRPLPHPLCSMDAAREMMPAFCPVTMIRRDPASGSQWNIGTIILSQSTFSGSNVRPVHVELTTPGYGRFAKGHGFETPRPGSAGSDAASIKRAIESATISSTSAASPKIPGTTFNRLVDFRKIPLSDLKRTVYMRTNSSESVSRIEPTKPSIDKNVLAFDSPWQGMCTFVNAIDGKSLKIKHTISSNSSTGEGATVNIAELRFNLGWSMLSNVKDARMRRKEAEPDKLPIPKLIDSRKENLRKNLQHFKHKSRESFQRMRSSDSRDDEMLKDISNINTPTTNNLNYHPSSLSADMNADHSGAHSSDQRRFSKINDDDENRISLKLGRERAGGGFRGHSAKLGKLIIEDEGLKMCDLVVGAAMGIWWQHYDG
ncbi:hypothetical protein LTR64_001934 [Lithohypha guttulata]|uniref:uncharacterized protein n=1 Tax=Lithohypha guttulata TaxID=1690604 RepID=UPI002DE16144|nr:hypothetical protein LTR51_007793 [Lithohypha guttulata]